MQLRSTEINRAANGAALFISTATQHRQTPYCEDLAENTKMSESNNLWSERILRFMARYLGSVALLALVAVFMPYSWMDGIHRALGMGRLPSEPIVGYLARSLSLFYALQGGLLLFCSFDLRRHRMVFCFIGTAFIFFGLILWGVDFIEGMPDYWKSVEGPLVIIFGIAILIPALRLKKKLQPPGHSVLG
jgi:hypothetical protein